MLMGLHSQRAATGENRLGAASPQSKMGDGKRGVR